MAPWRADALRLGYRSFGVFPLTVSGRTVGAINLYVMQLGFFDEEELRLLDDMAQNISFAMEFSEYSTMAVKARDEVLQRLGRI